ncbi:hypothetical protein HAX54_019838 [Datura stramonium]|uniref:RNA helicase n=1 Tax=Datura stramonium TaxID=4076 RepID=A0ABS8UPY2_DATST|nr:hypothetical protein [Datura stramonium]
MQSENSQVIDMLLFKGMEELKNSRGPLKAEAPSCWQIVVEPGITPARPKSSYVPPHLRNRPASLISADFLCWACIQSGQKWWLGSAGGAGVAFANDTEPFVEPENSGINFDAYEDIPVETSGDNVPPPVNTFVEIDLGEAVNQNIRRCKYVKPTPVQRHAIPIALAGRDLMACAQTGSGKTAAFFPIASGIMRGQFPRPPRPRVAFPLALILSPTRELSCQIHDEAKKFAYQTGVRVVVAYGGAPINQQQPRTRERSAYSCGNTWKVG